MHWFYLVLAIALEAGGTLSMKLSAGFTRTAPSVTAFIAYGLSLTTLMLAQQRLEVSFTYAIWSGVGAAAAAFIGMGFFHETISGLKIAAIVLVAVGTAGLYLAKAIG